jgi:peptidyl-prolyl cis-trans isomerase C
MQIKHGRWFLALVTTINLAWIALPALAAEKQASEGKVAVVNGSVITQEDFDREMGHVLQRLASMGKSFDDSQLLAIKKEVLEGLIHGELLYQESQRKGIKVEEVAINEQLETLKKRFPSEDEFKTALNKMNLSEADIRSQIKKGLAIQQFITKHIAEKVTVSDKELKAYYDSHPDSFKQPEQVRASHILIKVDPQADESQRAEARKKIEEIQQKLQKGEDFATLAKELSQGPSSAKGGDLDYFRRGQMVKPFEEAAFALKPGEVSDLVETRFGYHLIKVIDKKPETAIPYEDIKEKVGQYLKDKKVHEEVGLYVKKLKEDAKVERFLTETPK